MTVGRTTDDLRWRTRRRWGPEYRWVCVYCGTKLSRARGTSQVDHLVPYWKTRDSSRRNLVPVCKTCNLAKRGRMPVEWMQAVGVPYETIALLVDHYNRDDWRLPEGFVFPQVTLDYAAGKHLPAGPRQDKAPLPGGPLEPQNSEA
jgi:hypothetical protein